MTPLDESKAAVIAAHDATIVLRQELGISAADREARLAGTPVSLGAMYDSPTMRARRFRDACERTVRMARRASDAAIGEQRAAERIREARRGKFFALVGNLESLAIDPTECSLDMDEMERSLGIL